MTKWWVMLACAVHVSCAGSTSVKRALLLEDEPPGLEKWIEGGARPVATLAPDQPLTSLALGKAVVPAREESPGSSRVLLASLGDSGATGDAKPRGYLVPGRNRDSRMPWEFFLGHAAHRLIGYMYGVDHPGNRVYYNTENLASILRQSQLGEVSRLLEGEGLLCPDITDITAWRVFEIKPRNAKGLEDGRLQIQAYLDALNRAVPLGRKFVGGRNFAGATHILFGDGCQVWRLEWQTPEPGIVLYHWTRTQRCFATAAEAYAAGEWVEITVEEMMVYGGWVAQVVEGMVWRRETLAAFSEGVGIVVEVVGMGSVAIFSEAILARVVPRSTAGRPPMQPPSQGGGKVLPFPPKKLPPPPPKELPKASGM